MRGCGEDEIGWWAPWDRELTVELLPCPSIPIYSSVCSGVWDRSLVVRAAWGGCRKEENLLTISSPPCITMGLLQLSKRLDFRAGKRRESPAQDGVVLVMWMLSCRHYNPQKGCRQKMPRKVGQS